MLYSLHCRLRDVSNEEKTEHQRVLKDLENQTIALTTLREQKDRIDEELKVILSTHTHTHTYM